MKKVPDANKFLITLNNDALQETSKRLLVGITSQNFINDLYEIY